MPTEDDGTDGFVREPVQLPPWPSHVDPVDVIFSGKIV